MIPYFIQMRVGLRHKIALNLVIKTIPSEDSSNNHVNALKPQINVFSALRFLFIIVSSSG
jgi:hypothetical protein